MMLCSLNIQRIVKIQKILEKKERENIEGLPLTASPGAQSPQEQENGTK